MTLTIVAAKATASFETCGFCGVCGRFG